MSVSEIIASLQAGQSLDAAGVAIAAEFLLELDGDASQKAALLRALSAKGETASEIAGFVKAFLKHAIRPPLEMDSLGRPVMDVCGTGGDKLDLFNISTASMFVVAGAGIVVVKHGNRGITSKSGGADVLEALGVPINLTPEEFTQCVKQTGAGFMLAPQYHPAFKAVAPVRAQLAAEGVRTIFNLIGPLLNPVQPWAQLIGVYDPALPRIYVEIMRELGRNRAWAVHGTLPGGDGGMDEVSTLGPTRIVRLLRGEISEVEQTVPLPAPELEELKGGDATTNAAIITGILDGTLKGPKRDIVVANAAAGFQAVGLCDSWESGIRMANRSIDKGKAKEVLEQMRAFAKPPVT